LGVKELNQKLILSLEK